MEANEFQQNHNEGKPVTSKEDKESFKDGSLHVLLAKCACAFPVLMERASAPSNWSLCPSSTSMSVAFRLMMTMAMMTAVGA